MLERRMAKVADVLASIPALGPQSSEFASHAAGIGLESRRASAADSNETSTETQSCEDTDLPENATSTLGFACKPFHLMEAQMSIYYAYSACDNSWNYDDSDFTANDMCCLCQQAEELQEQIAYYVRVVLRIAAEVEYILGTLSPASMAAGLLAIAATMGVIGLTWELGSERSMSSSWAGRGHRPIGNLTSFTLSGRLYCLGCSRAPW
jgi:hypothetical protein